MIIQGEGTIDIPLEGFWQFIRDHEEFRGMSQIVFGYPSVNKDNGTLEVGYAFSSENNPVDWIVKPKCLQD